MNKDDDDSVRFVHFCDKILSFSLQVFFQQEFSRRIFCLILSCMLFFEAENQAEKMTALHSPLFREQHDFLHLVEKTFAISQFFNKM